MVIGADSILQRASHMWKDAPGGAVMLRHPTSLRQFILNRDMALIWRQLDGNSSLNEILGRLSEAANESVSPGFTENLLAVINEMHQVGLVEQRRTMWTL